jgi:hypothetical protein
MPNIAEANNFSNAQFRQSDLLKFIQEKGSKTLWRVVSGLDSVTKRGEWPGGKELRYHLTVDAGGGAFSGLNSTGGVFANPDKAYGIQAFMVPKYQTMTMYFDRIMGKLSDSDQKAYLGSMKMEYEQKTLFQKSFNNLQQIMDGTGRVGTPIGLGSTNAGIGADSFTLTNPSTLLKVKLSSADTATGSAAYFMEGMVVSFLQPNYNDSDDGSTFTTASTCVPRFMVLGFKAANGSPVRSYYDAFRVVRINQSSNEILLAPARKAAGDSDTYTPYTSVDASHMVQQGASATMWCNESGTVTVTPWQGRTTALGAPTQTTVLNGNAGSVRGFDHMFGGGITDSTHPVACFLVLTGYIPTGTVDYGLGNADFSSYNSSQLSNAAAARAVLGLGWDINVDPNYSPTALDISLVNPYLVTGIETLLFNETNMVQGVPRYSIQQYLPTKKDLNAQPLTFNSLFSGVAEHYVRNRDKDPNSSDIIQWNLLDMNPLTYTSILSLSETDRRITDDKGIRGTSCKVIQVGNKKFELNMNSSMRLDRIVGLPKDSVQMKGGTLDPVDIDGQKQYMALNSTGRRTNAYEQYYTIQAEQYVENLRDTLYFRNFTISII